jgi:hypothetical protein
MKQNKGKNEAEMGEKKKGLFQMSNPIVQYINIYI